MQRTISALPTLSCSGTIQHWANVATSYCRKVRPCSSLLAGTWSHALPCTSSDIFQTLLWAVTKQMRHLNQCVHNLCFSGTRSKNLLPRHHLPAGTETIFTWVRGSRLAACGTAMWCLGSRGLGCCSGSHLCRSEHHETEHWLSAPRRAGQRFMQGCGTDPVMCLSAKGSKRLPWGSVDCFLLLTCSAANALSDFLKSHPSLLLPGPWPQPEEFVLVRISRKSQKHQHLWSYPKTF